MEITIDDIIAVNEGILHEWKDRYPEHYEKVAVNKEELEKILNETELQESIIAKAAFLMAAISWAQPFSGGNKRTGYTCARALLRMNGYEFFVKSKQEIEALRKLLLEIQDERSELNTQTLSKIILYVARRIRKI
ncbi:MAG: Fic family protein [Nitrosopumilaceae archaeon]|nr:Fic family protein [Nitrosopumilaceae archaeon]